MLRTELYATSNSAVVTNDCLCTVQCVELDAARVPTASVDSLKLIENTYKRELYVSQFASVTC
jgi:hypothetical protein